MAINTEIPSLTGMLADHERRIRDLEYQLAQKQSVNIELRGEPAIAPAQKEQS